MLTAERLIDLEQHFGGLHRVKRNKLSPHHTVEPKDEYMQGGDRMGPKPGHGYAEVYARELQRFIGRDDLTIVEIGVLRGTGLAMWSKVFPHANLIGLDIDLTHFDYEGLKRLGAFEHKDPELHVFDQYCADAHQIPGILRKRYADIVIDDGCHVNKAVYRTFAQIYPFTAKEFTYFIEDMPQFMIGNAGILPGMPTSYQRGELTVLKC